MKCLLPTVLILGVRLLSFGQGTVFFGNASSVLTSPPDRLIRFDSTAGAFNPFGTNYAPAVSNLAPGLRAQLYYGLSTATSESLAPVTTAPVTFRGSTSANAGAWFTTTTTLYGLPLPQDYLDPLIFNFEVRIWDVSLASSYEAALADPSYSGLIGHSPLATQYYYYFPQDSGLTALQGFNIGTIPEPSVFALLAVSGGIFAIVRKRLAR